MRTDDIGIVVLNYILTDAPREMIASLKQFYPKVRTVIVDNGSTAETVRQLESIASAYENISVLALDDNYGYPKGINAGIDLLRAEGYKFICCSTAHMLFAESGVLESLKEKLGSCNAAVTGPRIIYQNSGKDRNPLRVERPSPENAKKMHDKFQSIQLKKRIPKKCLHLLSSVKQLFLKIIFPKSKHEKVVKKKKTADHTTIIQVYALHGSFYMVGPIFFKHYRGHDENTFLYFDEFKLAEMLRAKDITALYVPECHVLYREDLTSNYVWKNKVNKIKRRYEKQAVKVWYKDYYLKNTPRLKGLITYTVPQSKNSFDSARAELTRENVFFDLYPIKSTLFWAYYWKHLKSVLAFLFKRYDFVIMNPGTSFINTRIYKKLVLIIASKKKTPLYIRWGTCKAILKNFKEKMGAMQYQEAAKLLSKGKIKGHLVLTPFEAEDLASELNIKKSYVIYNTKKLPEKYLQPVEPNHEPLIINIASVQHRKGPDLFVKVAAKVCAKHPTAKFIWIGGVADIETEQLIKSLNLEERVEFLGKINPPYDYLQRSSALLFTSRSDAFGLACAEAMACYRTVICFAGSGPEFVVGDTGIVVPQWDTNQMAEQVLNLINKPTTERINFEAHERYNEMFSPEPFAKRLASILRNSEVNREQFQYITEIQSNE